MDDIDIHKKTTIYTIIFLTFLLGIILLALFIISRQSNVSTPIEGEIITTTPGVKATITPYLKSTPTLIPVESIPSLPPTPIAEPDDIIVGGIPVNNFLLHSDEVEGRYILATNPNYNITYAPSDEEFVIEITGSEAETARENAESVFLEILGIDKYNACRISVEILYAENIGGDRAGKTYLFSSCAHLD